MASKLRNEIERKFLVPDTPPNLGGYPNNHILQGYLVITDEGTEVRVRRVDSKYYQTIKMGLGLTRTEIEFELSADQFNGLWHLTENKRLEKIRYEISQNDDTIELDVYLGKLKGLITAEVEFDSEESSREFHIPDWFGKEITTDESYKNKYLATRGLP